MSSHVTDAEYSATNTALLAEMDLSTSGDGQDPPGLPFGAPYEAASGAPSRPLARDPGLGEKKSRPLLEVWPSPP